MAFPSAAFNITNQQATEGLNAFNAFLGAIRGAIRGGQPVPLVTSGFSLAYTLGGRPPNLQGANNVISGLGSLYGLHSAFQAGGSDLERLQATLSSMSQRPNAMNSIATYVQATWTTCIFGSRNMYPQTQTTCQHALGRAGNAMEEAYASDARLNSANGRMRARYRGMAGDVNREMSGAAYSIAACAQFYWATGLNYAKNKAL